MKNAIAELETAIWNLKAVEGSVKKLLTKANGSSSTTYVLQNVAELAESSAIMLEAELELLVEITGGVK